MEPTLRDMFAGYALMGILVSGKLHITERENVDAVSKWSYIYADAMLKERETKLAPLQNGGSYSPTSKGNSNN